MQRLKNEIWFVNGTTHHDDYSFTVMSLFNSNLQLFIVQDHTVLFLSNVFAMVFHQEKKFSSIVQFWNFVTLQMT